MAAPRAVDRTEPAQLVRHARVRLSGSGMPGAAWPAQVAQLGSAGAALPAQARLARPGPTLPGRPRWPGGPGCVDSVAATRRRCALLPTDVKPQTPPGSI